MSITVDIFRASCHPTGGDWTLSPERERETDPALGQQVETGPSPSQQVETGHISQPTGGDQKHTNVRAVEGQLEKRTLKQED